MGALGKIRVQQNFSLERMVSSFESLYAGLIRGTSPRRRILNSYPYVRLLLSRQSRSSQAV
jgi:hypothetical protein